MSIWWNQWYRRTAPPRFVDARKWLILCEAGGQWLWNPIEHRLFSLISIPWAGQPLRSLTRMTALIRDTSTNRIMHSMNLFFYSSYVLMRYALAPGTGDPANFQLGDVLRISMAMAQTNPPLTPPRRGRLAWF
ncbi:hypothetical protein IQ254_21795 [Nodosilinea sp. LEGE 07088]|uniref:ISAzo13-like element transposase-related protein n=1 Tax=Nodosilinea sp. LEGE 07088 TaxID=2777968 RepID=UPI0018809F8B|nr:hypothetical protein [Nodosilinea sp. LEGE 07088]